MSSAVAPGSTAAGGSVAAAPGSVAAGGYRHPDPSTALIDRGLAEVGGAGGVDLAGSYELCRRLHAAHGRTYYFATRFLPRANRRHVWALYGFARYADDLVDHAGLDWSPARRRAELEAWSAAFLADLDRGDSPDPVLKAVIATVGALGIARADLAAFLRSMAMDLTVTRYDTFADLETYVYGSAAVIGGMMLPVLGATDPAARAHAEQLGIAFQLTNFLRDVAEDAARGRIYLPREDLERFGVDEADLLEGRMSRGLVRLLAFEAARTREYYAAAEAGWNLLEPRSRAGIRIAHRIYARILDELEAGGWQVFTHRAHVPTRAKVACAVRELLWPTRPQQTAARAPRAL